MSEEWTDWEKLFARCATDPEYRRQLDEALGEGKSLAAAAKLLRDIGVAGSNESETQARIRSLQAARGPMHDVTGAFRYRMAP